MLKKIDENDLSSSELIQENLLYELFEVQYDDLFCKILKIPEESFIYFLKQQVIFNLLIIKKRVEPSIFLAYQELFTKRYKENLKVIKKNFEYIKNKEKDKNNDLIYLDFTKCFIHCHKCYDTLHKCGSKLILYDEYIFCIKCNNVYNKNQIMLFCPECNKNYYTKLRKPIFNNNKKFEKLFMIKFKKYHCPSDKEEKIKCIKCSNNLYFRLIPNNPKKEDNINTIYCIKCKLKYNIKDVLFKCKICLKNFKCQARIFRDFPSKKKKLLFLIHTLLRNINAFPNYNLCIKKCACDIKELSEYNHNDDGGKFLEGLKNNKKFVICNKCFKIYEYYQVKWNCPSCGETIKYKIINNNNSRSVSERKNISRSKSKNKTKSKSKVKSKNNKKYTNREIKENIVNIGSKKFPLIKINLNNQKKNEYNECFLKTEEINNKFRNPLNKKNRINNVTSNNIDNLKKIFINKNESNKRYNRNANRSFLILKSKSKNDLIKKNNNRYENGNKKPNNNYSINHEEKEKINNNILKESNNRKKEKSWDKKDLKINKEIKKNIRNIDTKTIFNNIKNNFFNLDEFYHEIYPKNRQKKNYKVSKRYNLENYGSLENDVSTPISQNLKKGQIFSQKILNNGELKNSKNLIEMKVNGNENYRNGELINSNKKKTNIDIYSNDKNESIQGYEFMKNNNKSRKRMHINYAKKIFFFNGKLNRDLSSQDQKINLNLNQFHSNDLLQKYIKNANVNIQLPNNNYINNSQYIFDNKNNYSNMNNDNYLEFQEYEEYYQPINLYNFKSEDYSIIKILGKGSNGKIYLVQDLHSNQRFALKSILIDNEIELKKKEEEYNLIYTITYEHPELKIVNIYGLELRKIDKYNMFLNILMEKGDYDWETEILKRKKTKNYYTEQELLYILANLVGTFAYLQQKGISHRDVKPQNILYFGNNEYKICDFGEAKYQGDKKIKKFENNLEQSNQTIRGTEMYMSPILFKAVKFTPDNLIKYNSFKSDVFSLGLCFLHASILDSGILLKVREISNMEKLRIIINKYLSNRYSQDFINLLLYMLQVEEKYRPDFIELNSWFLYENYS